MSNEILYDVADGVATVTLNRPEKLNTISIEALDELIAMLDKAAQDTDARAVILAANGRVFCAGADQDSMIPRGSMEWEYLVNRYLDPVRRIANMDKPVVARLHGDCVGGGLGLAMACDFRIAAEGIRLSAPFVNIGLAGCDMSAGYFLPRLVGLGKATDIMMTGRFVKAGEAERIGLITNVVPADDLDTEVNELAQRLAAGPPRALAFTKRAIHRSLALDMEAEFDYEIFAQVQCLQSEDHREGIQAFREKRKPVYQGK